MKAAVVKRLVLKDLQIYLLPILGLAVGIPALGLSLALFAGKSLLPTGLILMSNSLIWLGFFLPFALILSDKKVFILSLPISAVDWAVSKFAVLLAVFLPPWVAFALALPAIIGRHDQLALGSMAPITALLVAFLVSFLVTAAVAMVFESTLVTSGFGLIMVVVVFAVIPLLRYVPQRLLEHWASDRLVWDRELVGVLAVEVLCGLMAVAAAFAMLRRKRSLV